MSFLKKYVAWLSLICEFYKRISSSSSIFHELFCYSLLARQDELKGFDFSLFQTTRTAIKTAGGFYLKWEWWYRMTFEWPSSYNVSLRISCELQVCSSLLSVRRRVAVQTKWDETPPARTSSSSPPPPPYPPSSWILSKPHALSSSTW